MQSPPDPPTPSSSVDAPDRPEPWDTVAFGLELLAAIAAVLFVVGSALRAVLPADPAPATPGLFVLPDVRPEPTERTVFCVAAVLATALCIGLPRLVRPR